MITAIQALILGAIQGVTELFPISSLGHSVLIPSVLHWNIVQNSNYFLTFLVATHLATALVLIAFFFEDWKQIVYGIFRSLRHRRIDQNNSYEKIGLMLIVGTIPAGLLGILLQKKITALFSSPALVALFLVMNGIVLLLVEQMTKKSVRQISVQQDDSVIAKLSWWSTIKIGLAQCLALIPGFSRTGATLGGGLFAGLNHKDAARFSFLLATPVILAASVLKLPDVLKMHSGRGSIAIGFIAAAIAAFLSVKFLSNYFKRNTLTPFAWYCIGAGLLAFILLVH